MPQTGAAQDSWAEGWPQAPLAANTWSSAAASSSSVGHSVTAWLEQRFSPDGDLATLLRANFGPIRSDRHQARPSPYPAHHEFEPLERQSQAIGGIVPFPFPGEGAGNSISPPATEASYSSANHPEAASVFHNGIGFGSPPGSQAWLPPPPARTASSPGHMQTTGQQNRLSQFPQRRRIPQACVSCRESKRRCSGTRPCNGCIKRGLGAEDCKYEETESAKQARLDFERCMRTARQGLAPQDISTILSGSSSHHTVPSGHGQSEGNPSLSTSSEYHVGAQAAPHQSAMSSLTSQFEPAQAVGSSSKVGRSIGHDPAWSLQNEDGLAPLSHIPGAAEGYHKKPYPFPAFSHYALPTSGPSLNHLPPSLGSDPHVIVTPLTEIPSAYNDPPEGEPSPGVHIAPDPSFSRTLPLGYHNETWWEELTLMFGSTRRQG